MNPIKRFGMIVAGALIAVIPLNAYAYDHPGFGRNSQPQVQTVRPDIHNHARFEAKRHYEQERVVYRAPLHHDHGATFYLGSVAVNVPAGFSIVYAQGQPYYYNNHTGSFYQRHNHDLFPVQQPRGITISIMSHR